MCISVTNEGQKEKGGGFTWWSGWWLCALHALLVIESTEAEKGQCSHKSDKRELIEQRHGISSLNHWQFWLPRSVCLAHGRHGYISIQLTTTPNAIILF